MKHLAEKLLNISNNMSKSSKLAAKRFQVEYSYNNSQGTRPPDFSMLEQAGWKTHGNRAVFETIASNEKDARDRAIKIWERTTKMRAADPGCECCGPPHQFETEQIP